MDRIYRLTNIDTGNHSYFATLEGAMVAGDRALALPKGAKLNWRETLKNFSAESQVGYQKNHGGVFMAIIPLALGA